MILVDSSVWIDYFGGISTRQADKLDRLLSIELIGIPDLVLTEVLQGCRTDAEFDLIRQQLAAFETIETGGKRMAIQAAQHYRTLRALGITVRKTIDTLIATRCIVDGLPLLYSDRDFDPFVEHLGLRSVMTDPTGVN